MGTKTLTPADCAKCALKANSSCFFVSNILDGTDGDNVGHSDLIVRYFRRGETIFEEGKPYKYVAVIASGAVRKCLPDDEGSTAILSIGLPASFLGMPFINSPPYNVEAATDVVLCCISRKKFEQIVVDRPEVERNWLVTLLGEYERLQQFSNVLHSMRASERIASFFLAFCRTSFGSSTYNVRIPISRLDMSSLLGTTPETISRLVQAMAKDRTLMVIDRRNYLVLNLQKLESIAGKSLSGVGELSYGSVRSRLFRASMDGIDVSRRARSNKRDVRASFRPRTGSAPLPS